MYYIIGLESRSWKRAERGGINVSFVVIHDYGMHSVASQYKIISSYPSPLNLIYVIERVGFILVRLPTTLVVVPTPIYILPHRHHY
jgi:hypothetical protein